MLNNPPMPAFDPNSQDAMFATIMADVKSIKDTVLAIKADQIEHRQQTQSLLAWRENVKGRIAVVAVVAATLGSVGYNLILDLIKKS
jgi:hypothetical protein